MDLNTFSTILKRERGFCILQKRYFSANMNDNDLIHSTYLEVDASCQVMGMIDVDGDRLATTSCLIA